MVEAAEVVVMRMGDDGQVDLVDAVLVQPPLHGLSRVVLVVARVDEDARAVGGADEDGVALLHVDEGHLQEIGSSAELLGRRGHQGGRQREDEEGEKERKDRPEADRRSMHVHNVLLIARHDPDLFHTRKRRVVA